MVPILEINVQFPYQQHASGPYFWMVIRWKIWYLRACYQHFSHSCRNFSPYHFHYCISSLQCYGTNVNYFYDKIASRFWRPCVLSFSISKIHHWCWISISLMMLLFDGSRLEVWRPEIEYDRQLHRSWQKPRNKQNTLPLNKNFRDVTKYVGYKLMMTCEKWLS